MALLDVRNLSVRIPTAAGPLGLVHDVSFVLERGQVLGLLGESGCGKSMTALTVIGLLPDNMETAGEVLFDGRDLLSMAEAERCRLRGNRIGMIFQEPMTALNPAQTIGHQVAEPLRLHRGLSRSAARQEALRLLERIRLPNPRQRLDAYPHQLSGGQRQRVVIAMAIACRPDLLIADEPTTALDTTVQRQILDLLIELVEETGTGLLLITHDVGVMAEMADRVLVMYGGAVVETAATGILLKNPAHPYTCGLLNAIPQRVMGQDTPLIPIPGTVPAPALTRTGCSFRERCALATGECAYIVPPLRAFTEGRSAACTRLDSSGGRG
jgi:peptide/nickel transport system ATP-binding protein